MSTDVVHLYSPETYNYTNSTFLDIFFEFIPKNVLKFFIFYFSLTHYSTMSQILDKLCLPYADGVCSVMQDE